MPEIFPSKLCSIEGCAKPPHARGWCNMHWLRWSRKGDPIGATGAEAWSWHRSDRLKKCTRCSEDKPLGEFYAYEYTSNQGKRGTRYDSRCRPCAQARRRADYPKFLERERASKQAWDQRNVDHVKEYRREQQKLPEVRANKAFHQRHRSARLRAQSTNDTAEIRAIYAEAARVEKIVACCPVFDLPELGKKMHVDHIMPLIKGGKHEASNLQILPGILNMRKGSKCPR